MRRSLSYKILAAFMAAGSLGLYVASPAAAEVNFNAPDDGTTIVKGTYDNVYGNGTPITITGGTINANVYGIGIEYATSARKDGNVTISGNAIIKGNVYGACSSGGSCGNNTVNISGGIIFGNVYGAYSKLGSAYDNTVNISGDNITYEGTVYAGFSELASVYDNIINVAAGTNAKDMTLSGTNQSFHNTSNNVLNLEGNATFKAINKFNAINFNNLDIRQNTVLTVNSTDATDKTAININSFTKDTLTFTAGNYSEGFINTLSSISWSQALGNNVTIAEDLFKDVYLENYSFKDNGNNGIFVNQVSLNADDSNKTDNKVDFNIKVDKSILTGKFIDESGKKNINTQTQDEHLTIGNGFTTNVATVAGVYAAGSKNAEKGVVNISGDNISYDGIVYAGYSENGSANSNTINVAADTIASKMTLRGTYNTGSDNVLNLAGSATFKAINNFDAINFDKIDWINGGTVLSITNNSEEKALANTNININSLNFAGGTELTAGESMTIISNNNSGKNLGIGTGKVVALSNFTAGVTIAGTGTAEVASDGNSVKYTLTKVKHLDQIDLVAENRAVAAAFVNQGTDLIADSLDTISRDSNYGVKTFAAVHGNRSKYDVNSDIKINGWSVIAGVGNAGKFDNGSEFSWGVFYENGSGNYRTYNEFNNEFFRGDGSLVYNGGGIAARYTNKNGVYTEGSLRAGMLKSDMDNALRDGAGNFYGYESESAYYGAHIGIGKIISLSESSDLDVYGKFFHTYTEGDSFKVANDEFDFDSINSDRLRIGARITSNKENKFSTYYGLAYEYEFNGDADMTAQGLKAPTQSLQGSSVMAEIGFNYQPTPTSPWSLELNMRGYAGERQGGSFNVQAMYTF